MADLRLIYRAFIKIHIIKQQPSKAMSCVWGWTGWLKIAADPTTPTPARPPSQMIAEQSYEKRKGLFLINMWEVDFPCKAGLLRRKVRVCPLCTTGLCRKRVWFCRRLCLHLGYFRWPLQEGWGGCLLLYRCKETQEERCDCMHMNACACVWLKKPSATVYCMLLPRGKRST